MKLWEFIKNNLAFAFYGNPSCKYSEEEYELAKKNLVPFLSRFKNLDEELLIQAFACIIRHIKFVKNDYDVNWTDESMKKKGKGYEQYYRMIFEFNRVMQSFTYDFEGEIENSGKTFPIQKVIFKGRKKKQEIVLEGHILEILKGLFISFNPVYGKSNKKLMKDFSFDYYEAYQEFMVRWQILNAEENTIAKSVIKAQLESKKSTAFNRYKFETAYFIHQFLKKNSPVEKANYPAWHCQFIGKFFTQLNMADYVDYTDNKTIQNWIHRGSPEIATRTKKTEK